MMKLYYFIDKTGQGNFGDDLNPWLWEHVLPGVLDDNKKVLFCGLGTILNDSLPKADRIIVFGSGIGYGPVPLLDSTWKIYCLRGPISAKLLGVSADLAITDGAILVASFYKPSLRKKERISFMPHIIQARYSAKEWQSLCMNMGFGFIDPRWPVTDVLDAISSTDLLITESLHGAIIADSFRIPWIPVVSHVDILKLKWEDWCASIKIKYVPCSLWPFWGGKMDDNFLLKTRKMIKEMVIRSQLISICKKRPILSKTTHFNYLLSAMQNKLDDFKRDYSSGLYH